jgi:coenzyme F420-reducing hydrogenase delta subunit
MDRKFDDIVNIGTKDIEIANGVKILKKAVAAKTEGLPQGPYFKGGRDKYVTLPIRANILKAYNEGVDGLSIGANQAETEATRETAKTVVRNYKDAAEEIKKVLKELGVDEKGVLETVDTGSVFDGAYLKFTPELLDAISKRGINAFKYGGAVDIDAMLAEL